MRVSADVMADEGLIIGKVVASCACGTNGGQGAEEVGVPGVRVLLEDGTASITISASWFSRAQGAPKLVPLSSASCRAAITSGWAWPQMAGPQLPM